MARSRLLKKCWKLIPPDVREERGDKTLLLWQTAPAWAAVTPEVLAFLEQLDGTRTLEEVLTLSPEWMAAEEALVERVRTMQGAGLIVEADTPPPRLRARPVFALLEQLTIDGMPEPDQARDLLRAAKKYAAADCRLILAGFKSAPSPETFLEIAAFGTTNGFSVRIVLDGSPMTENTLKTLKKSGATVLLRLEGAAAETVDIAQGRGTFAKIEATVEALRERQIPLVLLFPPPGEGGESLKARYRLAMAWEAVGIRCVPCDTAGLPLGDPFDTRPFEKTVSETVLLVQEHPTLLKFTAHDPVAALAARIENPTSYATCPAGFSSLFLDADGTFYPCAALRRPEKNLGSLHTENFNFEQLWQSSPALKAHREKMAQCPAGETENCSVCPLRLWRLGLCGLEGCRSESRLMLPPERCAAIRRAVLDLLWLMADYPEFASTAGGIC